jgi:polygalacturonase
MTSLFYVRDYIDKANCDSEAIERCMADAKRAQGERTVIFDKKDFFIDRAILLPSDTTVVIDSCTIKQNDCVYDNVFRGDNLLLSGIDPHGIPIDVTPIRNIRIIGKGDAKIIGTDKPQIGYHPFFKEYQAMNGDFWGWRTLMFSFSNAKGIEIAGLKLRQTMCWAISFDNCQYCHVHDLDIRSNVKNGDGIDFRSGCNHCLVENITGFTSDDTVACTALSRGKTERTLSKYLSSLEPYNASHENIDGDVHHITIRGIKTGGYHHAAICLAAFGNKVHDIEIEDVRETDEGERSATVMVYTGYGDGYHAGDIHDIKISGVTAKTAKYALQIRCEAENLTAENIVQENTGGLAIFEEK